MPATAERLTITMPAEMAEALRQTVAGGEYASTSEVVREALRGLDAGAGTPSAASWTSCARRSGLGSTAGRASPPRRVFAELRARYAAKS